jgi:hypothetical protein
MANTELIGGVDSFVLYGAESSYGTGVSATATFGGLITSGSFEVDREVQEHSGFAGTGVADGRKTSKFTSGVTRVRGSVEFKVQRWDWLEYLLLGSKTGNGTSGVPYVYSLGATTKSLTVTENLDNDTDSQRTFAGMVINSASIRASVGEPVYASVELLGGKVSKDTSIGSRVAILDDGVYEFSGATIEMPDGSPLGNVIDTVDMSVSNNYEILYGLGNLEAVNAKPKKLNLSVRFTLKYLDDDQYDRMLGSSSAVSSQTPVSLSVKFVRGSQYADFVFTNVVIPRINTNSPLNEFVVEDVDCIGMGLTVTEVQS